ncbi:uncharacterized protein ELE39_001604 [Cryptosporidium sp. chipmunk genotype I]|uniref:uncharacterized protein n=1 Tax=Cryptosporidium sp. chipmunk genotype I TaxID=1280935 RepID=UPI00351A1374|nr:hypothetical protein ELE39_001604 [Cryptosporidium sp. chipmunk genotype I]
MENIHIFSGNIPAVVCTYFNKICLDQNCVGNANFEFDKNQQNSLETGSIVIFDSNFIQNNLFRLGDEPRNFLNIKHSFYQNNMLYHTNDNQASAAIKGSLTEQLFWDGAIDVFEQSSDLGMCPDKWNSLLFLKRLVGEKNVHNTMYRKCSDSTSAAALLNNSYGLSTIDSRLESDEVLESVRHKLENSDHNKTIHLSTEVDSVFSNISNEIFEFLDEEAPRSYKPSLSLLINENTDTKVNDLNLIKILSFANIRFLLDQSNYCDDIWLINLKYIESLVNRNSNTNYSPITALAFVVYQTGVILGELNKAYVDPPSILGRSVGHPFRNIAIFNPSKAVNVKDKTKFVFDKNFESLCSNYFLDMCQSEYFGLDLLDHSEIITIINENQP